MVSPQLEKGFIQIATGNSKNDILKALIKAELSGTEYQIILLVIRQTYGFKKKEDWISLTQFEKITNKSRARICESIKQLVKKNILVKKSILGKNAYFSLNKDFDNWNKLVKKSGLVKKTRLTSKENKTQLVKNTLPTKETITKEIYTKETRLDKPTKRKSFKYPKEWYNQVITKYQFLKGIQLQGEEFKPVQQVCKTMFMSNRTPKQIISCMEWIANSENEAYQSWTIRTIKIKLPEFLAGKLNL